MAESTLSLTYTDFQREVAFLLGWSRNPALWDNTQEQDFSDIQRRALRMFYFPPQTGEQPVYEWTFLRKEGSITLATSDAAYDLPDDFGGTILDDSTSCAASSLRRKLKKIPEGDLRNLQAFDPQTGFPKYFAVRNKTHSATAGQRWEFTCYPTPGTAQAAAVVTYRYVFVPDILTSTNIYPVGGAQYSEVILAAYLACAEYKMDDDPNGPFAQKFTELLQAGIRNDTNQKTNDRGGKA